MARELGQAIRAETVWRTKVLTKLVISRFPVSHATWRKVGIFRLGYMDAPEYAMAVFDRNTSRYMHHPSDPGDDALGVFDLDPAYGHARPDLTGLRLLELGPGERLFPVVMAHAADAASIVVVDASDFASRVLDGYQDLARLIAERWGEDVTFVHGASASREDLLMRCHASYCTRGLASLRSLDSESIDIAWSHAMLEHVRESELLPLLRELRRVISPRGVASHQVDLRDHLDNALNNLRFSRRIWESRLFARSGFYTNRIGFRRMLELFETAGFDVELERVERWDRLPTARKHLAPEFRSVPEEDLLVNGFDAILRPA